MWLRMLMMRLVMVAVPLALMVGASHLGIKLPFADMLKQQLQFAQASMGFGTPQTIIDQIAKPAIATKKKPAKNKGATGQFPQAAESGATGAVPVSNNDASEAVSAPAALVATEATPDAQ